MINKIVCNSEDLTAIADAVRANNGSTNTYNVPELSAAAVNAIGTGGAGVSIDDTLTVSGAAADAKVVGDRIAALNEEMADKGNVKTVNGVGPDENGNVTIHGDGTTIDATLSVPGAAADAKATGDRFAELTAPPETTTKRVVQLTSEGNTSIVVESDAVVYHTGKNLFEVGKNQDDYVKASDFANVDPLSQTICLKVAEWSSAHAIRNIKIPFNKGMSICITTACTDRDVNVAVPLLRVEDADGNILTSGCTGLYNASYTGFIPSNHGDVPPPSSYTYVCDNDMAAYCRIGLSLKSNMGVEVGEETNLRILAEIENPTGVWEAGFVNSHTPVSDLVGITTVPGVNNFYAADQSEIAVVAGTSPIVQSVNGKKGIVVLTAKDVGAVYDTEATDTVYSTVRDMLEDVGLAIGKRARTLGYYSADDGGGARYTVDAANAGYGIACKNGYCNIVGETRMSPKMFGAIGNGDYEKTNDTEAFQACMDFCAGRYVVDISDGCYVIAGVKLYHGKVYDITGSHRQYIKDSINKLPGSIVVKYGAEAGFVGDTALGTDETTGIPLLTLNLYNIHASGYYNAALGGYPTFVKGVMLTMSRIDNVVVNSMGCFIDGIMKSACEVSNCYITVSDAVFRSHYVVNGEYSNGFVDCYFYSNLFMGIMKFGNGQLFKPVVFDAYGFYTIQFSNNFVGGMWAVVGYRRLHGSSATNGEFVGWVSCDNVYSYVKEFATAKDDATHVVVGNFKSFRDQIWHCSYNSLTNTAEGRNYFDDMSGNTRITGDRTPFFSFDVLNIGTIRDLVVRFCDPVFLDEMSLRKVTINRPIYLFAPDGHDYAESENLFDTKIPIVDFESNRDTQYKYTRIDPWNDRVVETLPIIQDANYRYVLEGQTCYYNNKLLTCRGDNWYDAMGNVVTE